LRTVHLRAGVWLAVHGMNFITINIKDKYCKM